MNKLIFFIILIIYQISAIAQFNKVAPARDRAKIHVELAALYFQYGKLNVAIEEIEKAIEIDKNYAPAYAMRGIINTTIKQPKQADEDFRIALSREPNNPEINNNYGWFLCQTNLADRAYFYFQKAYNNPLYETPELAYANAGDCSAKQGDYPRAEEYLLQSQKIAKNGGGVTNFYLAKLYLTINRTNEAKTRLKEAFNSINPPTAEMYLLASRIEKALGNIKEEMDYIELLKNNYPDSKEYRNHLYGE